MELLKLLGAPTECFSENRNNQVDVTAVCHDASGLDLSKDDKVFITVKDMKKHSGEQTMPLGCACQLKAVELDASLLIRVWAARDEATARLRSGDGCWGRRNCGELRIPLPQLLMAGSSMIYQTWLLLDVPGLNDSVASVFLYDEKSGLEKKFLDGPRQLLQPRLFLSVGRTADLGPRGEWMLQPDSPFETQVQHWTPLLRSQQQHAVLSAALHFNLSAMRASEVGGGGAERAQATARVQDLRGRLQAQSESLESLRRQVLDAEDELKAAQEATRRCITATRVDSAESSIDQSRSPDRDPEPRSRITEAEVESLRSANSAQRERADAYRAELARLRQEGNVGVDSANEQIRRLKRERDEANREAKRLEAENEQLAARKAELSKDNAKKKEKVKALKRLVEELYAGSTETGRARLSEATKRDLDSVRAIFS